MLEPETSLIHGHMWPRRSGKLYGAPSSGAQTELAAGAIDALTSGAGSRSGCCIHHERQDCLSAAVDWLPPGNGSGGMIDTLPQQKTLPHSEESERAVLGGILLDPAVLPTIAGRLRPDDFYLDRHRVLYRAMLELQEARVGIDLRTVQAKLEQQRSSTPWGGSPTSRGSISTCRTSAASTPTSRSSRSGRCGGG